MPSTNIYGFPYENIGDQPGHTLHGGEFGTEPILAIEVEEELNRVEIERTAATTQVAADLADLAALFDTTGAQTIDTIDTGNGTNTTEFTGIPQDFRVLAVFWEGVSDGGGEIDALAVRFNSDGGNNYVTVSNRNTAAGAFTSDVGTFSVARAGQVGTFRSGGMFFVPAYNLSGASKMIYGNSSAVGQSLGANVFTAWAGGRWTGTAAVTSIRIWPSGQQWDGDPHLTLIGFP